MRNISVTEMRSYPLIKQGEFLNEVLAVIEKYDLCFKGMLCRSDVVDGYRLVVAIMAEEVIESVKEHAFTLEKNCGKETL